MRTLFHIGKWEVLLNWTARTVVIHHGPDRRCPACKGTGGEINPPFSRYDDFHDCPSCDWSRQIGTIRYWFPKRAKAAPYAPYVDEPPF